MTRLMSHCQFAESSEYNTAPLKSPLAHYQRLVARLAVYGRMGGGMKEVDPMESPTNFPIADR